MSDTPQTGQQDTTEPTGETQAVGGGETETPKGEEGKATETAAAPEQEPAKPEGDTEKLKEDPKSEVPETYDLKRADESPLDDEALKSISETAKAMKLTNEQAQQLVELQEKTVSGTKDAAQEQWAQLTESWVGEVKADKEIGGEQFEESMKHADAAMTKFATPEFKAALNESGYGNHPELVRVFARIGKAMAEDKPIGGDAAKGGKQSRAEILYPQQ